MPASLDTVQSISQQRIYVAVVGASDTDQATLDLAEEVGGLLALAGAVLVCGGLSGVMEAACRGARGARGTTVGILPGDDRGSANPFVDVAIATGLGEARNAVVVNSADAVVAVGGEYGTLSEIALALKAAKPVVGLGTWELARRGIEVDAIVKMSSAEAAVAAAIDLASPAVGRSVE
jgi:uncharacterized protein (TIGR00725 family)